MMKKIIASLFLIFVSANVFSYTNEVTKKVIIKKPIKYVYRVTLEALNKCNLPSMNFTQYMGAYYDDNDTASITMIGSLGVGDAYKLKKIDANKTELSYFKWDCLTCSMARAEATLDKTLNAFLKLSKFVFVIKLKFDFKN
jgi:hypothetical protein